MLAVEPGAMRVAGFPRWVPATSAIAAALWVGAAWLERRLGRALPQATAALVGLSLGATVLGTGFYAQRSLFGDGIRTWSVFHYHTGSRWFPKMGYDGLYAAVLAADDRWQAQKAALPPDARAEADTIPDFRRIRRTRDMRTYDVIPRARATAALDRSAWTDAELDQLGRETRALVPRLPADTWDDVFLDLGYNPAPPWTIAGRALAAWPADGAWLRWICSLDLIVLIALTAAIGWGFGPRTAAASWLFLATVPFNDGRLFGNLLQYDWLLGIVGGIAAWRRGFPATAGVALAWAAGTRVFPGLLLVPLAVELVVRGLRRQALPRDIVRLLAAAAMTLALLFAASHTTGRGLRTWPEWREAIAVHVHTHPVTGDKRVGLGRLMVLQPTPGHPWGQLAGPLDEVADRVAERALPFRVGGVLLIVLAALRTRRDTDRVAWMLPAVWLLTVSSRYYASAWILLFAFGRPARGRAEDGPQDALGVGLGAGLLLLPGWMEWGDPEPRISYFLGNLAVGALFGGVVLHRAVFGERA